MRDTDFVKEFIINPRIVPCPRCQLPIARWGAVMVGSDYMLAVVACDLCNHWGEAKAKVTVRGYPRKMLRGIADYLCRKAYDAACDGVEERHQGWRKQENLERMRNKLAEAWATI